MDLRCLNNIIDKGLAVHIDLTDTSSWDLNNGFTSISLNQWSQAKSSNLNLYDFGLTGYDNGRVSKMYDTLTLTPDDTKVQLYRVGYNTSTGGTYYNGYGITGVTQSTIILGNEFPDSVINTNNIGLFAGNHFNLDGGFLQGFFKLYNYDFEILPDRYGNGVTIETIIRLDDRSFTNNGFIFFMGERAEDKYNGFFSGETAQLTPTQVSTLNQKETIEYLPANNAYSGVTTGEGNFLAGYKTGNTTPVAYSNFDQKGANSFIIQPKTSIYGNVIGIFLAKNGSFGFRYISDKGDVLTRYSEKKITRNGWIILTLTFKPYETIDNSEDLECAPRRKGDLKLFVNGREFWKIEDFDEFYFKNMKNQKEKQLGVPYNISWGGGSFGLKHSWHYDFKTYDIYDGNDQQYIDNNFIQKINPLLDDHCITPITGTSATTGVELITNNDVFYLPEECDPDVHTPITVLEIHQLTGVTGTNNTYYFEYAPILELLSNREYVFSANIFDTGIFDHFDPSFTDPIINTIKLVVYGNVDVETVEEIVYSGNTSLTWFEISKTIKLKKNTGLQNVKVGLEINSTIPLVDGFILFVNNFKYRGSDKLVQDSSKDNLTIETNFSNSFIGGIQKLRLYDYSFNSEMALHNASFEASNNAGLNIEIVKGGRLIHSDGILVTPNNNNTILPLDVKYSAQLVSTGAVNANVILPISINWNTIEYLAQNYFTFTSGSRIFFKINGIYKLSYNVLVENNDFGEKVIGVSIRKNGVNMILPYNSPIYVANPIGYRASGNISDYLFTANAGDYVELITYRIGGSGSASTVPNGVYITIETT